MPYLPLPDTGPELLDADGARTLVWGVGRHRTEDLTPEIDQERTADATARAGGAPHLRHVPEKRLREVWLWIDATAADPNLELYAEEIASSLEQNGLPARIGTFEGYPEELVWDEGQRFRPGELEGHRQTALVAVMTDGELLARHASDIRRADVTALLTSLASWERLTVVDFSEGRDLAALVERYDIPCLKPEALPDFFGSGVFREPRRRKVDEAMLRTWRVGLALAPRASDRTDAYALRRQLRLDVSPWELRRLAPASAFCVHLDLADRKAQELHWLRDSAGDSRQVLTTALSYWSGGSTTRNADASPAATSRAGSNGPDIVTWPWNAPI